jgi:hypothetical protein
MRTTTTQTTRAVRIFDTEWKILDARDEGSDKFVRGSTIGIAVCDEVVLVPEGFFKMLLTRRPSICRVGEEAAAPWNLFVSTELTLPLEEEVRRQSLTESTPLKTSNQGSKGYFTVSVSASVWLTFCDVPMTVRL